MACNCKKRLEFEEQHGTKKIETLLQKSYRAVFKLWVLLIGFVLSIVVVPVTMVILIFNQVFRGGKGLTMPKVLTKYMV